MPKYKLLVTILILGILFAPKFSAQTVKPSNLERYAYQYIVELYERGAGDRLNREIHGFMARYPQANSQISFSLFGQIWTWNRAIPTMP